MEFGQSLKAAREKQSLTQQQVAERLGVTKSTYCGYETGKRQPDVKKIRELSEILQVPADVLLDTSHGFDEKSNETAARRGVGQFSDKESAGNETKIMESDEFSFAMHNASRDLTAEDKRLLLEMAERLRKMRNPE